MTTQPELSNELQQRLVTTLDYLGEIVKQGADGAKEQLPLLARDIVTYGAASGWCGLCVCFALSGTAAYFARRLWLMYKAAEQRHDAVNKAASESKSYHYSSEYDGFGYLFPMGCVIVAGAVSAVAGSFTFGDQAIKATFAPRVYLIEWVADKLK